MAIIAMMERVSISQLKDQLSAYLKKVRAGETVLVMDRNTPVARIEPIHQPADEASRIAQLEAAGILLPPKGPPLTINELRRLRVVAPGARVLEALLDERREGR
jgi:prevent-host-death family protein